MESWLEESTSNGTIDEGKIVYIGGVAHDERGDFDAALTSWSQAMEIDPSVFRRVEIALPAQFFIELWQGWRGCRCSSSIPRFYEAGAGFVVQVEDGQTCLLGTTGEMFYCAL